MPSSTKVSFLEETVYNVTLAGLRDQDMQERCLAAAYMKTIGNVTELVKFCSADKASRIPGYRTIGGLLTSSFQQGKKERVVRQQKPRQPSLGSPPPAAAAGSLRCLSCSGACRNRATKCRACNVTCRACQRPGHLDNVCPSSRAPGYASRNAALASETPEKPESEVGTFAFCAIFTELDQAGQETLAPQSPSPPESWGLSTGAEVPVLSAVAFQLTSSLTRPSLSCPSQSPAWALVTKTNATSPGAPLTTDRTLAFQSCSPPEYLS